VGRFNKHVIVAGSARSGTSWLSETMAQQFRYRMLFEPEHEFNTGKGQLLCDKWITTTSATKKVKNYLTNVFLNRVNCDWIAQNSNRKYNRHLWPFIPKKFIIKFVRCNLSAAYMNTTFQIPTIHMLRNPYDVIASQQKVKFQWLYELSHFQKQPDLVALLLDRFSVKISDLESYSEVELLALRWCIENVLPLEVFEIPTHQFEVVRYEYLIEDVQHYIDLCKRFDVVPAEDIATKYRRPSSKTHPTQHTLDATQSSAKFDVIQLQQINKILQLFKTKLYPIQVPKLS